MAFFSITYLASLICLYSVLGVTLGLKSLLLVFGAVHLGSLLLLLMVCWSEIWAEVPARLERKVYS